VNQQNEIGFLNKLLYASSSIGVGAINNSIILWLFFFYAPPITETKLPLLIPTAALGVILFIILVLDTLDESLIGFLSDKTKSRLGRRAPFIIAGTPFWILFYVLLWIPPVQAVSPVNTAYLFFILWAFYLFATISGIPYEALLPEIAKSSRERLSIASYQVYFALGGAAFGLLLSGFLKDSFGFLGMAIFLGSLGLIFRFIGLRGAWSYMNFRVPPVKMSFLKSLKTTLKNRHFLIFLPSFIFFQIAAQLLIIMTPFYVEAVLKEEREGAFSSLLLAAALVGIFTSLPLAKKLTSLKGKKVVFLSSLLAASLYLPLFFFMGFIPIISPILQSLIFIFLAGFVISAVYLMPAPIIADIVDNDEAQTGFRREAIFYGSQNFFEKAGLSLTPLIFSGLLLLGSTPENPIGIRLVGPVAGIACFVAFLVFRNYKLEERA